ncbi:molybdopterin molybdotransferase [Nocardiopsis mwathae]|uniref:Molybdopterin molybdenumtransferase n=1 Tax=Nocardiopsis mwathae TaxID=1472723 RepID=A0A7W9YJJ8_9ACTN|nr:molybdopterin-binding protein [Nocardiopsis mwathae]MBB6172711.1 molybdopterin molybdotransferase [Nocardiopsis mwathae]
MAGDAVVPWTAARAAAQNLGVRCPAAVRLVALDDAVGAALAADLVALVGTPAYDAAAMDGYAVAGRGPWVVRGRLLAGSGEPPPDLRPGEAVEIATGAPVPGGTEAVLPYESAVCDDAATRVRGEIEPGRHVRWAGEDTRPGASVLAEGAVITPATAGLAASLGHDRLPVRRPTVDVLVSGDEITAAGIPAHGRVRDAIGPVLPGLVRWAGGEVVGVGRVADTFGDMLAALRSSADTKADVIAVCGASSKGPADHLRDALGTLGATPVVDGVACRPGHPQLLAHLGEPSSPGPVVVGLPGNPNAALVAALTLLAPLLAAAAGRPDPGSDSALPAALPVEGEVRPHHRDTRLVAVRVESGRVARPVGHDRPGSLRGAAMADAFAVIPPDWRGSSARLVWLPAG